MDPSTSPSDAHKRVGNAPLSPQMAPLVYDPQLGIAPYSGSVPAPAYHAVPAPSLYFPSNWSTSLTAPNISPGASAHPVSPPGSSDDGDLQLDRDSTHREESFGAPVQKTLFIAGFPADVKEREIFNLLRFQPGFVDCCLTPNGNGKQAVAFASWQDHSSATRCKQLLHGLRFDPYGPPTYLRVQFARAESKSRRTMLEAPYAVTATASASASVATSFTASGSASSSASAINIVPLHSSTSSNTGFHNRSGVITGGSPPATSSVSASASASAAANTTSSSTSAAYSSSSTSLPLAAAKDQQRRADGLDSPPSSSSDNRSSSSDQDTAHSHTRQAEQASARGLSGKSKKRGSSKRQGSPHSGNRPSGASSPPLLTFPAHASASASSVHPLASNNASARSSTGVSLKQRLTQTSPPQHTCSTLFITNLNLLTVEDDLLRLFQSCEGFRRLRFQLNSDGAPIAFVDFDSDEHSCAAKNKLNGNNVHHTPIRIEFARQKMKRSRKYP